MKLESDVCKPYIGCLDVSFNKGFQAYIKHCLQYQFSNSLFYLIDMDLCKFCLNDNLTFFLLALD